MIKHEGDGRERQSEKSEDPSRKSAQNLRSEENMKGKNLRGGPLRP